MPNPNPQDELFPREDFGCGDLIVAEIKSGRLRRGTYTGHRLAQRDVARFNLIVELLGEDFHLDRIARLSGCSWETVAAIRDNNPELVREGNKRFERKLLRGAEMCLDRLMEKVAADKVQANILVMGAGVLTDKYQVVSGKPTEIRETRRADVIGPQDFDRYLASLRDARTEPVQLPGAAPQKEGEPRPIEAEDLAPEPGPVDTESTGFTENPKQINGSVVGVSDSVTDSGDSAALGSEPQERSETHPGPESREGGGGVERANRQNH